MNLEPGSRVLYKTSRGALSAVFWEHLTDRTGRIMVHKAGKWRGRTVTLGALHPHPRQLPSKVSLRVQYSEDPCFPIEVLLRSVTEWHSLQTFATEADVRSAVHVLVLGLQLVGVEVVVNRRKPASWADSETLSILSVSDAKSD